MSVNTNTLAGKFVFSLRYLPTGRMYTESIKVRLYGQHFSSTCVATLLHCKLKPAVARITTCVTNLFRNKTYCCKFAQSCPYDWSVVCKQRWRLLNSFSVGRERLPLSVWACCTAETRKGVENEIGKCTCGNGFPGERREERGVFHQLIRELEVGDVVAYKVSQRLRYPSRSLYREHFWLSESLWSTASNSSSSSAASAMFFFNLPRSRDSMTANHKR